MNGYLYLYILLRHRESITLLYSWCFHLSTLLRIIYLGHLNASHLSSIVYNYTAYRRGVGASDRFLGRREKNTVQAKLIYNLYIYIYTFFSNSAVYIRWPSKYMGSKSDYLSTYLHNIVTVSQ